MMNEASISELLSIFRARNTFVITSHQRPDGDAIGTALGMMHLLETLGKQVIVAFADPIPMVYACLEGVERIVRVLPVNSPDAFVILECDRIERSGFTEAQVHAMRPRMIVNIDHHLSGRTYADFNWIDPIAPAVGAMVYDIAVAAGLTISRAMAECLYVAILTDTGSFHFTGTSAATFAMASHLVDCGMDPARIAQCIYANAPLSRIRLLGRALDGIRIENSTIAWSVITLADMENANATVEDCEGIVNHLIAIAGIEAAALLRESLPGQQFRMSLRSKGTLDVAKVAEHFNGGGHRNASGCTIDGTLNSVMSRVLDALQEEAVRSGLGSPFLHAPLESLVA